MIAPWFETVAPQVRHYATPVPMTRSTRGSGHALHGAATTVGLMRATTSTTAPRTLAEALRGFDDAALVGLLRARPDIASPVPTDTLQLASRACTRASVSRALDRLDRFTVAVVEAVAALPEPASLSQVGRLLDTPGPTTASAIDTVRQLALLWGDDDALRLVRAVHEVIGPHPAGLGPWASTLLAAYDPARLEQLVTHLGLQPATAKMDNVAAIVDALKDAARLDALRGDAGGAARAVLDRLAWGPPVGRMETLSPPVARLIRRGLLVATDRRTVVLPREVGLHLRQHRLLPDPVHEPPPLSTTRRDPALVDRPAAGAAFELVRRVELLLDSWSSAPPAVLRGGGVSVRDLRRAATLLDVDAPVAALIVELAHEAHLLDAGDDEVWLPTVEFDRWLGEPAARRWATIAAAWLTTQRAVGLVGRRDDRDRLVNALSPDLERTLAPEIRDLTLRILADLEPGHSTDDDAVSARAAWTRPRHGGLRDDVVAWTLREAAELGVSSLGVISSFGRALLHDAGQAAATLQPLLPATVDRVLLQADLTAVAPGPLDTDVSVRLAACADVESRGGATVYRFSADSVRRALDAGWSAADLHAFVGACSRTPVPQPLTYLIDDVARRHGRLRVGVAESYVRSDDDAALAELVADPRASTLRLRRLATGVLVTDVPIDVVLARLREWGRAPVAETADGTARRTTADRLRTPVRRRRQPRAHDVHRLDDAALAATVAALRAGDRTAAAPPTEATSSRVSPAAVLAQLREAAESGASVLVTYVDQHGARSERVVDPIRVEGGWVTALDHRSDTTLTLALHRVSDVSRASPALADDSVLADD